jgi:soluble lytic murein transglycosylase-like protein
VTTAFGESIPREAMQYQRDVIRQTRAVWGLDAPVAVFAAQIHQESRWRPAAKSKFASGLAQFTPDTAKWISGAYPQQLGKADPGNPAWAIQALAIYDKELYDKVSGQTECDRMAFALSGYNSGPKWVTRDKEIARASGKNPEIYFGSVESVVDSRKPEYLKESRGYPPRILKALQPIYTTWGRMVTCT